MCYLVSGRLACAQTLSLWEHLINNLKQCVCQVHFCDDADMCHMYVISAVFQFFSKRFQRLYQIDTSCHHAKIYMYRRRNAGLQITAHTQPCLVSYHVLCFRNNNHDSNSHSARSQIS